MYLTEMLTINGTSTAYGSAIASNDVVMFAMDLDNRKFYIGKNGTWFNSGNPVSGTNQWPYSATIVGSTFFPAVNMFNDTGDTNFGQRSFTYTPPSGFVAAEHVQPSYSYYWCYSSNDSE